MSRIIHLSWILALTLSSSKASAHSNLLATGKFPPRNASTGLKLAPCGAVARTATNVKVAAGSTQTVSWQETINHPGHFEIWYSPANDANWVMLKSIPDDQNDPIVGTAYHMFSTTITMPNTPCDNCTLQLIQSMEENPAAPTYYYSCSDIQIQSLSVPAPTPAPAPSPAPAPAACP